MDGEGLEGAVADRGGGFGEIGEFEGRCVFLGDAARGGGGGSGRFAVSFSPRGGRRVGVSCGSGKGSLQGMPALLQLPGLGAVALLQLPGGSPVAVLQLSASLTASFLVEAWLSGGDLRQRRAAIGRDSFAVDKSRGRAQEADEAVAPWITPGRSPGLGDCVAVRFVRRQSDGLQEVYVADPFL